MGGLYLLDVDAWTGSAVETLRLSTKTLTTRPTDSPANTVYSGRISDSGQLERSLFAGGGISGSPSSSAGAIEFANADGRLDPWLGYGFDGRAFTLRYLASDKQAIASAVLIMRGTCLRVETPDATKTIRLLIRDRLAVLDTALLTTRYAGTTITAGATAEGDADQKDEIKPRVFGSVQNIAPRFVNRFNLIYQVSAGAVSSIVVYDGAAPLTLAGDHATLAALTAATLVPGEYATALGLGLFRLGGSPSLTITADVVEGATLALRSAARVAGRMLDVLGIPSGDRVAASFDAVHAFNPAEVGIYVDSDVSALEVIGQVLNSVGCGLLPSATGEIELFSFAAPSGTPVATYTRRDLIASGGSLALVGGPDGEGQGIPAWSVVLNYARVWQTMSSGDVAGVVTTERKDYLAKATRQATAQNAATRTARLLASEITIDTLLMSASDAGGEAARRLALYGVRRDRLAFPVPIARAVDVGAVVRLQFRRFGYDGGKLFRVIGRTDDFSGRSATLDLWG